MWVLWACAMESTSLEKSSHEEMYEENDWSSGVANEADTEEAFDNAEEEYAFWNIEADIYFREAEADKEKSMIRINVFSDSDNEVCSVVYQLEEALPTEPTFEEGLLWWRLLLVEGVDELQQNLCTTRDSFPQVLHIGIGTLHIESLAVWSDVHWGDVMPPQIEDAYSAYISLDNGQSIWVYGAAKLAYDLESTELNAAFLRPAYFFLFD